MKIRLGLLTPLLLAVACSSAPAPAPAPAPPPRPIPPSEAERPTEAPDAWQLLDLDEDRVPGTSTMRAYRELLAGRQPQRTIVVAIIDSGVDTAHVDLRGNLWRNPDETPGNGVDDDGNGYVDDVRGWSFLGGPDGRNVEHETLEVTRLYAACQSGRPIPPPITCQEVSTSFESDRLEVDQALAQIGQIEGALGAIQPVLQAQLGDVDLTADAVRGIEPTDSVVARARALYLQLDEAGLTSGGIAEAKDFYEGRAQYHLNPEYDPRGIVGDDPADGDERGYGSNDVTGPEASHGTHVAGIIGAMRGNGIGLDGIASDVRLMSVRAVPDGDERDKDVANAIRYAVDNGAQIINMSFGKPFSPEKSLVDDAVRYAEERGVLLVHAAGNDAEDNDVGGNFPTPVLARGGRASNWIEVGASNWVVESLAAGFSNYGQREVSIFAPGVDIYSTEPANTYDSGNGTSFAAPVVTGVAALLMAYFPELSATDVKRILLASAIPYGDQLVPRPGAGDSVPFGTLSETGGVVNAYEAVRMALEGRPRS
jgi:subtilisin family serine protease